MKITKRQLKRIIKESEQYVDEDGNVWDDEGNVTRRGSEFGSQYGGDTYGANAPWKQSGRQKPAKATFVGDGANGTQIAAVEKALEVKPDNFLTSILNQLKQGRKLSVKQKSIVRKILAKSNATAAQLFEAGPDKIRVTKTQLKSIIKEEASRLLREEEEGKKTKVLREQSEHEMLTRDDELKELEKYISDLNHFAVQTADMMHEMSMRYGELSAINTYANQAVNAAEEVGLRFETALNEMLKEY